MQPNEAVDAAVDAAARWLAWVDAGDGAGSWTEAAALFKATVSAEQWQASLGAVQGALGTAQARTLMGTEYATTLPGAPDGEYVVIQYETRFERKQHATETITPMRDPDGAWRVSGYFVQ